MWHNCAMCTMSSTCCLLHILILLQFHKLWFDVDLIFVDFMKWIKILVTESTPVLHCLCLATSLHLPQHTEDGTSVRLHTLLHLKASSLWLRMFSRSVVLKQLTSQGRNNITVVLWWKHAENVNVSKIIISISFSWVFKVCQPNSISKIIVLKLK